MTRFNDIVVCNDSQTVEIGAGLTWTDVYAYLVPKGVNVVGGRLNGVGVAGFTLGGGECHLISSLYTVETDANARLEGYSWKSNEYGLAVDSVTQFNLVSPNGTEIVVTEANEDLWFALKVCLDDGDRGRLSVDT
jgi:FAD/FMN-containing dehydrogenase